MSTACAPWPRWFFAEPCPYHLVDRRLYDPGGHGLATARLFAINKKSRLAVRPSKASAPVRFLRPRTVHSRRRAKSDRTAQARAYALPVARVKRFSCYLSTCCRHGLSRR